MAHRKRQRTSGGCTECDVPQLARNHYFTGKLLVERDFTDEQRYHVGKARRHNRVLHGWGTACGLKVTQHPNPACRDRFVMIQPGVAIDCCGREIVVQHEETFDFRAAFLDKWRQAQEEAGEAPMDGEPPPEPNGIHRFQVCLRYRECPTEEMPALFDDCGCNDRGCEPNRILESFELDLVLDPEPGAGGAEGRRLDWVSTLHFAGARTVAHHEESGRLYVLTGPAPANLYQLSARTESVLESRALTDLQGRDLAVSADGTRLYVLANQEGERRILVLDTAALAGTPVQELSFPDETIGRLVAAPDGRLFATWVEQHQVRVWGADINEPGTPADPTIVEVDGLPTQLALSPGGRWAFAADGPGDKVWVIDTLDLTVAESFTVPEAHGFAAVAVTGLGEEGDNLALTYLDSASSSALRLVGWRPNQSPRVVFLGEEVAGLAAFPFPAAWSTSGRWLYLGQFTLEGQSYLQAVDAAGAEDGLPGAVGPALSFPGAISIVLGGSRLYVPFGGDDPETSGVAVIAALGEDCCDLLERVLDPCPDCGPCPEGSTAGLCVVLATVEGYEWGDRVVDVPLTEEDLDAGPAEGEAWIDNRLGRRLLASTQLLTEMVECLCARGGGEPGEPGPPGEDGQDGQDGAGIDDVTVDFVPCDQEGEAEIVIENGVRTLHLTIPGGCVRDLTRICGISWVHGGLYGTQQLPQAQPLLPPDANGTRRPGLLVAFDGPVRQADLNAFSVRVFVALQRTDEPSLYDWPQDPGVVRGAHVVLQEEDGHCQILGYQEAPTAQTMVNGALFLPGGAAGGDFLRHGIAVYRLEIEGDLIRDEHGRGIDANHLPPWLSERPTGDGIEGGRFQSWFYTRRSSTDVNDGTLSTPFGGRS